MGWTNIHTTIKPFLHTKSQYELVRFFRFFKLVNGHFHGLGLFIPKIITPRKMLAWWNTGRFANESVRQRPVRQHIKSIRQRRMSVRQRLCAIYFGSQRPKYFFVCLGSGWKNEEEVVWRVNERTRNKLYGVECWVHIFSALFGLAVDKRTRNNWYASKGKKWLCIFCSLAALANCHSTLANRLHTLANWSLANWLVGETTGYRMVADQLRSQF